jgi:hypothetical protein
MLAGKRRSGTGFLAGRSGDEWEEEVLMGVT